MVPLNQNIQKLIDIAQKPVKIGIGLMSGTSLDGLDIALCRFTGNGLHTEFKLLQFVTIPYEEDFKKVWDNFIKEPFFDLLSIKRMCALFFLGGKASENKDIKIGELLK